MRGCIREIVLDDFAHRGGVAQPCMDAVPNQVLDVGGGDAPPSAVGLPAFNDEMAGDIVPVAPPVLDGMAGREPPALVVNQQSGEQTGSAAGPGDSRLAKLAARLRYAPPTTQLGRETVSALTFKPDQSTGAGHRFIARRRHARPPPSIRSRTLPNKIPDFAKKFLPAGIVIKVNWGSQKRVRPAICREG